MVCAQDHVETPYEIAGVNSRDYMYWNMQEEKPPHKLQLYQGRKVRHTLENFCILPIML